jgi:hypothetical protein
MGEWMKNHARYHGRDRMHSVGDSSDHTEIADDVAGAQCEVEAFGGRGQPHPGKAKYGRERTAFRNDHVDLVENLVCDLSDQLANVAVVGSATKCFSRRLMMPMR